MCENHKCNFFIKLTPGFNIMEWHKVVLSIKFPVTGLEIMAGQQTLRQCQVKIGFVWSNCWMTGHFVQLITLGRKIWFRASSKLSCALFLFAKERKKKENKRWLFQSSVSIVTTIWQRKVLQKPLGAVNLHVALNKVFSLGYHILFLANKIFSMATILQLKITKRQRFEKVSLERWEGFAKWSTMLI